MAYAQTGVLVLVMSVTSSVIQPLVGLWSDSRGGDWTVAGGVAIAGAGVGVLGLVASFGAMVAATAVAGLGIALFHPRGARRATQTIGDGAATGLSLFALGGTAGFALAPLAVTPAVLVAGLSGTAVVIAPTLVVAVLLSRLPALREAQPDGPAVAVGTDRRGSFLLLTLVACLRAGVYFGVQAYLAAAMSARLHVSQAMANATLSVVLIAGALGTLAGGRLADRIGPRDTIRVSLGASIPALAVTLLAPTPALAVVACVALGLTIVASYSATVVLGQRLLPSRPDLAAGTTLGFAMGGGGVIVAALGPLADRSTPATALWSLTALALAATVIARWLPADVR